MVWAIIRCNLADPAQAEPFNEWYNREHVPRYVAQPGFVRGWRLQRLDHPAQRGLPGQRYAAIYETRSVQAFNDALDRDLADGHPWEAWATRIKDWQRTYFRSLRSFDADRGGNGTGRFWTFVRVDLEAAPDEVQAFDAWYNDRHVPEVTAFPGFRRAWRLELQPDDNDLGPRGQRFMAVYETDDPDALPRAREGTAPWDGVWADRIRNWEIAMYRKIYDSEDGTVHG